MPRAAKRSRDVSADLPEPPAKRKDEPAQHPKGAAASGSQSPVPEVRRSARQQQNASETQTRTASKVTRVSPAAKSPKSGSKAPKGGAKSGAATPEKKAGKAVKDVEGEGGNDLDKEEAAKAVPAEGKNGETKGQAPLIVFAHGAGAGSSSEFMQRWQKLLLKGTGAVEVVLFDYPYLAGGKKRAPPKAEKLVDFHIEVIQKAQQRHPDSPLILCGKSMGSRVSCMVAGREDVDVAGVVCFGYPLKGMNGKVRDETLLEMKAPALFVQGSKDTMCPLEHLEQVMKKMGVETKVHVVDGGDHSLKVTGKRLKELGKTAKTLDEEILDMVKTFVQGA